MQQSFDTELPSVFFFFKKIETVQELSSTETVLMYD